MKNRKKSFKKKAVFWLVLIGFLFKIFRSKFKKKKGLGVIKDNLEDFVKGEKKEVRELKTGKESFKKYCHDSFCLFKNYFIPNNDNGHKPKILRHKSLAIIVIGVVIVKLAVTGYLYFVYPNQAKMSEEMTAEIMQLINRDRAKENLAALDLNKVLSASALAKADDMAINNYFAHYSPSGKKPWDWISRNDYPYLFVGENLAINFTSAEAVHKALMNSPSHKKNILNERYQDVGLAVVSGEINGERTNILVELFAVNQPAKIAVNTSENIIAGATLPSTKENPKENESGTKVLASEESLQEPAPVADKPESKEEKPVEITIKPKSELARADKKEETKPEPKVIMFGEGEKVDVSRGGSPSEKNKINPILESEKGLNNRVTYFAGIKIHDDNLAAKLVHISRYVYFVVLLLLILALLVNIVVKIGVQHKPVIIHTLFTILLVAGLLMIRLHILEQITDKIALL